MINLIFPKTCYVCQKEGEYLCESCFKRVVKIDPVNRCHICNKESRIGFIHKDCAESSYIDGILNLSVYDGLIKHLIYEIKYNYYFSIIDSIAKIMSDYLAYYNFNRENSCLSYVPSSKKKLILRGFNQSELLAKKLSKNTSIPFINLLSKTHNTGAQAKLHKSERAENLKGAFELAGKNIQDIYAKNILIIDDVFTTGATLNECAKVIKQYKPEIKVFGFVIAKARS